MKLTNKDIEYGVIMQAIDNAKNEIAEGTFIDPYSNEEGVTDEQALAALVRVEQKLMAEYLK